ncbi:MAG: hypothetical protein HGB26_07220 [Desulfobulbaceae bacterium]|nr:hypothetical protein [Desulfobulbaceae bacterium]
MSDIHDEFFREKGSMDDAGDIGLLNRKHTRLRFLNTLEPIQKDSAVSDCILEIL